MTNAYRSYDYLEPGRDFRCFELPAELHRVDSATVPLTPEQRRMVDHVLERATLVSLHDHPTVRPSDPADFRAYRTQGREVTGYVGLRASSLNVVVDGMMAGAAFMSSPNGWKWSDVVFDLGMRLCDLAHQDYVRVIRRMADIEDARASGRIGIVFAIESAAPIENELDRLDVLFGLGVRIVGLTYNTANALGAGLSEASDGGLTSFGRAAVRRMNQVGLAIDLSHTGERTSLDVIESSDHPTLLSHTGARSLWDIRRLKSDDVLRACAERGGLIGIGAAPHTTVTTEHPRHNLESVMAHFEYCAELVGIEHVGFGPDTNYGDHVAWHREFAGGSITLPEGIEPVDYVDGMENPTEAFTNVVGWLVTHGYADRDIERVVGGNALRLFADVWPEPHT